MFSVQAALSGTLLHQPEGVYSPPLTWKTHRWWDGFPYTKIPSTEPLKIKNV